MQAFDPMPRQTLKPQRRPRRASSSRCSTRELAAQFGVKDEKDRCPFLFDVDRRRAQRQRRAATETMQGHVRAGAARRRRRQRQDRTRPSTTARTAFEARPQPERLENFDSQLADETRFRAMCAILASWAAILLYLWFRFGNWTFGLAAVICLVHDLFFTLGVIAACHYIHGTCHRRPACGSRTSRSTCPPWPPCSTLVGYSVNDTIVVFDRIREVRGKNPDLTPQDDQRQRQPDPEPDRPGVVDDLAGGRRALLSAAARASTCSPSSWWSA